MAAQAEEKAQGLFLIGSELLEDGRHKELEGWGLKLKKSRWGCSH